jgi:hypothetical protein
VPVRLYIETDPVAPQIQVAQGNEFTINLLAAHTHHFTYGENLGAPDCGVPITGFQYHSTRPPIILDWWPVQSPAATARFTTIANWKQAQKDIEWNGQKYTWSKHAEFVKFLDLPRRSGLAFELALAGGNADERQRLTEAGWRIVEALPLSLDISSYRDYIRCARGEFTVAKDQNIRLRSGWFSDRSATFLAAGRPVVTQDTGFGNILPTGRGLFAFQTMDDILVALRQIEADYAGHCRAARSVAAEHFAAERVLGDLLRRCGVR